MSGSKILWLQVITVFSIVIAAIWGATEWTAWQLAFQPELSAPWWLPLGVPVYLPPAFFWWWFAYCAYAQEVFLHGAYIVAAGTLLAIVAAIVHDIKGENWTLFVGSILHVLYAEPDKTLAGVANFLSDPKRSIESTLRAMMLTKHLGDAGTHPVVASAARELLNKSDNERSGVLSTAMSFLGLYRDPVIAQVTRRCDWRIADLVEGERPTTLYLVIPPSDISRTKPLIRLVLNQIGPRLTKELQPKTRRHRVLLMLDKFLSAFSEKDTLPSSD
jgi:type IV secretory pathway TraG/TraD family ATPase VirD4